MPIGLSRLLTTRLLKGLRSKIEAIRFFATLNRIDPGKIQNISFQNCLDQKIHNSDVKDLVKMGARIATFANDAEIQSAGSTLSQLQIAYAGGAMYIDRGWQTLVNGLSAAAVRANVKILTGKTVMSIEHRNIACNNNSSSSWILHLSDGSIILSHVLITCTNHYSWPQRSL